MTPDMLRRLVEMHLAPYREEVNTLRTELGVMRADLEGNKGNEWQPEPISPIPIMPATPFEVFDNGVGLEAADGTEIDYTQGPPDGYDGWKVWRDARFRYFYQGDEILYAYRYYVLRDRYARLAFEGMETRAVVEIPEE